MLNHATFRQLLGELWAVLRHQDQAVTLVQQVFGVRVAVMGELPRCGGFNDTLYGQPFGAHFDVVVLLFQKLRNLTTAHDQWRGRAHQRTHCSAPFCC